MIALAELIAQAPRDPGRAKGMATTGAAATPRPPPDYVLAERYRGMGVYHTVNLTGLASLLGGTQ